MHFVLSTNRNMFFTNPDRTLGLGKTLNTFLRHCFSLFFKLCLSLGFSLCLGIGLSICFGLSTTSTAQNYSADMFPIVNGTEVQVLSDNFLSIVTVGQIVQNRLELYNQLIPTQRVQVIFSNAQTGEVGILPAIVSFEGDDLLIPVTNNVGSNANSGTTYISLRNWLLNTKGITLSTLTSRN